MESSHSAASNSQPRPEADKAVAGNRPSLPVDNPNSQPANIKLALCQSFISIKKSDVLVDRTDGSPSSHEVGGLPPDIDAREGGAWPRCGSSGGRG